MKAYEIELILEDIDWNKISKVEKDLIITFKWCFGRDGFLLKGCCEILKAIYERTNSATQKEIARHNNIS